jgi:hypothetical protein
MGEKKVIRLKLAGNTLVFYYQVAYHWLQHTQARTQRGPRTKPQKKPRVQLQKKTQKRKNAKTQKRKNARTQERKNARKNAEHRTQNTEYRKR